MQTAESLKRPVRALRGRSCAVLVMVMTAVLGQRFEVPGLVPTPTLSLVGLAVNLISLLGAGAFALRRRKNW